MKKQKIIVFMGMPWTWKSTLGRHYAYNTNKAFFDADDIHKPFGIKKKFGIYKDHTNYYNKIIEIIDILLKEWDDVVIAEPLKKESQRKLLRDKYWDILYVINIQAPSEEERINALIKRYSIEFPQRAKEDIITFIKSKPDMEPINEKNLLEITNNYNQPENIIIEKIETFLNK